MKVKECRFFVNIAFICGLISGIIIGIVITQLFILNSDEPIITPEIVPDITEVI
jgi:uncharacterized protein with PQ loop repeat